MIRKMGGLGGSEDSKPVVDEDDDSEEILDDGEGNDTGDEELPDLIE